MDTERIGRNLIDWFGHRARDLPWRRTRDPYAIWVSEIMLQQTQVKTVLPYWSRWMRALPTIQSLARARPARLHKLWEGLGYYRRVRNLHEAAKHVITKHKGAFPQTFDEILALPGIGRYTAGAICSIAFNQPTPILDGNVVRVLSRVFGIKQNPKETKTNRRLWRIAEDLVQTASELDRPARGNRTRRHMAGPCSLLNQSLMELGAVVCLPRQPKCMMCPLATLCIANRRGIVERLPHLTPRPKAIERRFVAFVVRKQNRFLVRQRPNDVVNALLWEFPNIETSVENSDMNQIAEEVLGVAPARLEPLCTIRHSITRYRITLDVFNFEANGLHKQLPRDAVWLDKRRLNRMAFSSAHKRILAAAAAQL